MEASANLEVFVAESLQKICDAAGRTKELKQLHDQSKQLIEQLRSGELGRHVPFSVDVSQQLLVVFKTSFATANPRLVEPALSCLHKLVAYAYLQGETTNSGRLDDANLVTQAVTMTARCGESNSPPTQLAVIKALLTFVTAEHFLVHGDTLMQAVRTVFNLAIGSTSTEMQSTATSALLQMLNTVLKRVGQQVGSPHYTPQASPLQQLYRFHTSPSDATVSRGLSREASGAALGTVSEAGEAPRVGSPPLEQNSRVSLGNGAASDLPPSRPGSSAGSDRIPSRQISEALALEMASPLLQGSDGSRESDTGHVAAADTTTSGAAAAGALSDSSSGDGAADADAAMVMGPQEPSQQEQEGSINGAEHRLESHGEETSPLLPPGLPRIETKPRGNGIPVADEEARAAQLASLAEQADLRGLERAFDSVPAQPPGMGAAGLGSIAEGSSQGQQETPPDPRRAIMRDRRATAWRLLTVVEKDAVIVLGAMCKLAARETGFGAMETYMHKGKLLALDLLLRVLSNPMHDWAHVRPLFAGELRQPLCVALLRNCMSPYDQALTAAVKIFNTVLAVPKLRSGMKAELGALYPLLLLRPIESERPDSAHQVQVAVEGILGVCSSAQVLVDVFVNYDCSLQASNLFERTMKALAKLVQLPEAVAPFPAAITLRLKATALKAMLAAAKSLDTWAGPIKSAAAAAAEGGADGLGNREPAAAGSGSLPNSPQRQMLEMIAAAKEMKDSLQTGIAAFNKNPVKGVRLLIDSGIVEGTPEGVARFLQEQSARLDKTMVGELFGDHEDFSIQIMHAYIDLERYAGLSIDAALRKLLSSFRLPGEAQKIDRIMEKFAERYCRDNPAAFASADGAYLLAFAIIMLNTDAHNPMADRRIMAEDFVAMSMYQTEAGEFEAILPAEELEAIYKRITENEIKVREDGVVAGSSVALAASGGGGNGSSKLTESSRRSRLALAVGLPQMVLPFWSGATWDKQHGVDVERKRLVAITQEMVASGGMTGNMWHTASHAEHARPMLQVGGESVLRSLSAALAAVPSLQAAAPILDGYEQAIQLAALLRLEGLCEALLGSLASAAGLEAPAPYGSPQEAKQVAALSKLISLGSCTEAGLLGTSWIILLRTLSQLEKLQAQLMPGAHPTMPYGNGMIGGSPDPTALPPPPQLTSTFGRLLQRMGLSSSGSDAGESGTKLLGGLPIREGPGAGFVLWAQTAGATPIERVYSNSANLPGDAVVTFMRALCAVSQEELIPAKQGERPRVHLLQKVVECAYHNMGRIRLVWTRLWTVVAQHLVSAACHTDAYVAMYAVDALRQLVAKLLDKAELARFTYQGDALRPFAAILRHSDSHTVRELAVACVVHAITAHPRGLGSGWRSVIEALTVAAGDSSPGVVNQALDALQPVLEALYHPEGIGHAALRESVTAVLAAVHNRNGLEDLSIGAVYLFQILARRVADAASDGANQSELLPLPSPIVHPQASELQQDAAIPPTAEQQGLQQQAAEGGPNSAAPPSKDVAGSASAPPMSEASSDQVPPASESPASCVPATSAADPTLRAWQLVLVPLGAVARQDSRPKVSDTAASMLFQILRSHGHALSPALWHALYCSAAVHVLALPQDLLGSVFAPSAAEGSAQGRIFPGNSISNNSRPTTLSSDDTPVAALLAGSRGPPGGLLSRTSSSLGSNPAALLAAWCSVGPELSTEGLYRLERHASAHMPDLWALLGEHFGLAGQELLPQVLTLLQQYVTCSSEPLAVLGVNQLHHLARKVGPVLTPEGWQLFLHALEAVCLQDPLSDPGLGAGSGGGAAAAAWVQQNGSPAVAAETRAGAAGSAEALRRRCRLQVLMQRVLDLLLQHSAACMPGAAQLQLLDLLRNTVRQAEAFNGGYPDSSSSGNSNGNSGTGSGGAYAGAGPPHARLQAAAVLAGATGGSAAKGGNRTNAGAAAAAAAAPRLSRSLSEDDSWEVVDRLPGQTGQPLRGPLPPPEEAAVAAAAIPTATAAAPAPGGALLAATIEEDSSSGGMQSLLPALVRQEVLGGCLLIAALQRCSDQPLTSDGMEETVRWEAETRLARYCLEVVAAAAERLRAAGPAGAAAAAMAATAGHALQPWEETVRAPLVEAALAAVAGLGSEAWRRHQPALFLQLSQLVCTPSVVVRKALAQLMRRQLPAAFPELMLSPAPSS